VIARGRMRSPSPKGNVGSVHSTTANEYRDDDQDDEYEK